MKSYKTSPYWWRKTRHNVRKFFEWVFFRKYLNENSYVSKSCLDSNFVILGIENLKFIEKASKLRSLTERELNAIIATEKYIKRGINNKRELELIDSIFKNVMV